MDLISPVSHNQRAVLEKMVPFSFPPSKYALWNPSPIGESSISHLTYYRNPKLNMTEKTLRLAHRHAKQSRRNLFTCFLVGTLETDEDGEGILLTIDRFDPGRQVAGGLEKIPTAPLPGDFLIPCTINFGSSSGDVTVHSSQDFSLAFKVLQQNLNTQDCLDPSKLLTLRVHISSVENMDNLNFEFHWAAVTLANALKCTPVKSVPIIPTALARNLSSHLNIAQVQGTCKCGYLTMDQTRKLLLVLESDPKAYTLPLVGIWLSGISHIYSPQVWAFCLRYLFSNSIQERVSSESGSFLIVLYSLKHNGPEFYECFPCGGCTELGFQLLTSKETLHLFKNVEPSGKCPIQFELSSENKHAEMEFFSKILKNVSISSLSQSTSPNKLSDHDSGVEDDTSPRLFPSPYPVCQQITEIQPSVPELSIVFDGGPTELVPKHVMITDKKNKPPFGYQPAKITCPAKHPPCQLQNSDCGKHTFSGFARESFPKELPRQLKQKIPILKPCKRIQPPLQQQPNAVGFQARKNFESTSSSSSASPNTSPHQLGKPETYLGGGDAAQRKGQLPISGPTESKSKQSPVPSHSPCHSCGQLPPHVRSPVEHQIPIQHPHCCPPCVCSCQLHNHMQYTPTNAWQGVYKMGSSHTPEIQSGSTQETTELIVHQNMECTDSGCNLVSASSSPMNLGHYGIMGNWSPCSDNLAATRNISSSEDSWNAQSHAVCSKMRSDNEMMGLSSDVYRILTEQDRQIKLLQAQIQRLLEAQTLQSCSTIASNSLQSKEQLEFVAMETQSSPVLHMKKSVSIAVSTGASLYLNAPLERNKDSVMQDDGEISNEDINISMNTEKDKSQTSIASSLKVVDIPSFVDSVHIVEEGPSQHSVELRGPAATGIAQTSLLNESVSMCLQSRPSEGTDNHLAAINEQNIEKVMNTLPNVPLDDQKFYQDILGQVNHFLKASSEVSSSSVKEGVISNECSTSSKSNNPKRDSTPDPVPKNKDSVLNATLKQLKKLGVNFDCPNQINTAHKVENASIMTCIHPEAVIPGLNYFSFANVGTSGLTPNGVDLSMEANAIALKYLSENQLSQLSLSRSSQKDSLTSSLQTLLHTNTDKTFVGFGLISPSNMSFATRKYMKKYGLLQSCDNSDDDEQLTDYYRREETLNPVLQLDFSPAIDGLACWKDPSERIGRKEVPLNLIHHGSEHCSSDASNSEGPILRNVTNAVLPLRILHQSNESSDPVLKDLKPKMKLVSGKAEFTQHPDKENLNVQIVPETPQTPTVDYLNQADNMNSVGTFLDVQQLRQLPKLL
ncbi:SCL-interrupting locus protein [Sceloporus undulatus]|uniref:SCL-interrupting locus protein n=1 Tax=Sceloporus undulatus TaxID=8520 RepID=UPI001C4AB3D4|nr:SCL-interrupting locus protein [Sceloporus undulatus]